MKAKAKELVERFYMLGTEKPLLDVHVDMDFEVAKQCALICVDEILKISVLYQGNNLNENYKDYWQEVKQEINNL